MVHLLRGAIIRILFFGLGYMFYRMKDNLLPYKIIISDIADEFR